MRPELRGYRNDCIYQRGLLRLPSDKNRAMREASECRTATDTDSYAFSFFILTPTRGRPRHFEFLMTEDLKNLCAIAIGALSATENNQFDSHDVIKYLYTHQNFDMISALWNMVDPEKQSNIRHRLHLEIGKYIVNNQDSLGIEFIEKHKSTNYKGVESLNALWREK